MNVANELLEKAKTAKTAEELLEMAKAEGIQITLEEAEKYFSKMHKTGELSDDELDNVAGGCGENEKYKFNVYDEVKYTYQGKTYKGVVFSRSKMNGVSGYYVRFDEFLGEGPSFFYVKESDLLSV